jgi:hypothetical protein
MSRRRTLKPSPLVGEDAERRSREAGEGGFGQRPLTRPLASLASTLSHEGRGSGKGRAIMATAHHLGDRAMSRRRTLKPSPTRGEGQGKVAR